MASGHAIEGRYRFRLVELRETSTVPEPDSLRPGVGWQVNGRKEAIGRATEVGLELTMSALTFFGMKRHT